MDPIEIQTENGGNRFLPGDPVTGTLRWCLDRPAEAIELQLRWMTHGRGISDCSVVDRLRVDKPPAAGERPFSLRLPDAPYSFSGKLLSVRWQLCALTTSGGSENSVDIVVSPTGREIKSL